MTRPDLELLWIFSSFGDGPAARRFAKLAAGLGDRCEHVIGAVNGDYGAEALIPDGVRWRRLPTPGRKRALVSIGNLWNIRKLLLAERPHLLLTSNCDTLEWLMLNRGPGAAPHIHFEDPDGDAPWLDDQDAKRAWARRRAFPGRARRFIAASGAAERLLTEQWGAPADQVARIADGVDLAALESPARAPRDGGEIVLGALGPLIREKRLDRLLRLTASLRDRGRPVTVELVGDGPERAALETEIETLGLTGAARIAAAPRDPAASLRGFDIYALTSDQELAPETLAAAMASGLPAVATDTGDVAGMLSAENRLFVRPLTDESALAAAAELLVADSGLRAEIGAANRRRAEAEYGLDAMIERYDALFTEMTAATARLMLPAPEAAKAAPVAAEEPAAGRETGAKKPGETGRQKTKRKGARLPVLDVRPIAAELFGAAPEPSGRRR